MIYVPLSRMNVNENRTRSGGSSFSGVIGFVHENVGTKEEVLLKSQNAKRHYSEVFSQEVAEWFAGFLRADLRIYKLLPPEHPVNVKDGSKRHDIAAIDKGGKLILDISIKTFNFVDRTNSYGKNFTGRWYELLGESFEIHDFYPNAVMVAVIVLPMDSCFDSTQRRFSSFNKAVKRFGKSAGGPLCEGNLSKFEFVFIGIFNEEGIIRFFNAQNDPPPSGLPNKEQLLRTEQVIETILNLVELRKNQN